MDYGSQSEGEIIEDRETKATTTQTSRKGHRINGHDRPRSHNSGSARPPEKDRDASDHRHHDRNGFGRDGGGGPLHHDQNPRGLKRGYPEERREDQERSDSRRFKIHYEENSSRGYGRDRSNERRHRGGDVDRGRHEGIGYEDYEVQGTAGIRYLEHAGRSVSSEERSRNGLPSERTSGVTPAEHDRRSAKQERLNTQADDTHDSLRPQEKDSTSGIVPDEAALIEERRKRRDALRAKHNRQTPLVQQVLQANAATSTTPSVMSEISSPAAGAVPLTPPMNSEPSSPSPTSPSTPQAGSPSSPFEFSVATDAELANASPDYDSSVDLTEGPSAADYDPSMDMQEDRVRDANPVHEGILRHTSQTKPTTSVEDDENSEREFDMFADDVEIESPEATAKREDDGIQAVSGLKGKQLDQSMLDDWDDAEGYYRIILGELLDKRYQVHSNLGKGVFSAVVRATDNRTGNIVAIKVIRKQESMYKAGLKEIHTLERLTEADPEDKRHVIRLERHFMHKGHLCMVFENLSINLREVLKKFGRDVGINIKAVRAYAQQIFLGLSLMRKCDIIHADLKPDNVLVNENRSQLKIADLGSAFDAQDSEVTDVLVSRFYRAPEIMLGIKGDCALDMWSIGCTLFELYTGRICFTGPTNNQMLKAIMECRGKIPNRVIKKAEFWDQHFESDGTFLSQEYDTVTRKDVVRRINLVRPLPAKEIRTRVFASSKNLSIADTKEMSLFVDLLERCLAVDPARRITPNEALRHGFINRSAGPVAAPVKTR
ncbi:hypothetical protein CAC42_2518 [Sphaceloma murrayae]|uniref:non-specific serine/threonine protein kinase n=1 Tax=Sphaceloma murrayae TaxID=2082308 RepID=A0A2K1QWB2_9PEZI|nr:hypothetical protein CAC42_2518 [Sphaceloma murrayae]